MQSEQSFSFFPILWCQGLLETNEKTTSKVQGKISALLHYSIMNYLLGSGTEY